MSGRDDSRVVWLTCPDCGSKIGVVISVGKPTVIPPREPEAEQEQWPPSADGGVEAKLKEVGVDTSLLNVEEGDEAVRVTPKKFLGDLWGPVNDAIKTLGGVWIREGRDSRWEIRKTPGE